MFSNFTVNLGLRYDRDTGRTDNDLRVPFLNNLLPTWPNLGAPVPTQSELWTNAGNRLGSMEVWQDGDSRRYRLYYENVIWNNVLFDRPLRLPTGAFLQTPTATSGQAFALPGVNEVGGPATCGTTTTPIRIGDRQRDCSAAIAVSSVVAVYSPQSQS